MQGKWSIREAKLEDAAELLAIYAPYVEKTAITFEYTVPSVAEFAERMQQVQQRYPYLVAEQDGKLLGYVYAGPFHERAAYDWAVETSLYVRQGVRYWNCFICSVGNVFAGAGDFKPECLHCLSGRRERSLSVFGQCAVS